MNKDNGDIPAYSLKTVRVHILDIPYQLDKAYDYYVPLHLRDNITAGKIAVVPFGGGNIKQLALVVGTPSAAEVTTPPDRMKPVLSVIDSPANLALNAELLKLCFFMKDYTFCTVGDAVKTLLPSGIFAKYNEIYSVISQINDAVLTPDALIVYNFIKDKGAAPITLIKSKYGNKAFKAVNKLVEVGLIRCDIEFHRSDIRKTETLVSLGGDYNAELKTGPKQAAVIAYLLENGRTPVNELRGTLDVSPATLKSLAAKDIISTEKIDISEYANRIKDPYGGLNAAIPDENILSAEQNEAYERLCSLYETGEAKAALLHGVTGSGKTRVIKALMDRVIADGRKVICLIPEIALTPQTVMFYKAYYGERVVVVHSMLSAAERYDAWRKMMSGEADICVGTRSAVFAPFVTIGLIIIDEEQEYTYKSDQNPRYHARDIARFRCAGHKALMLLSSATPSLESVLKARSGLYSLVTLMNRYGGAVLPQVITADMKADALNGRVSPIGSVLESEIQKNLDSGEQTILFLNRRGYNNYVSCPICGEVIMCPHCSVSMTYHNPHGGYGFINNESAHLKCHYCGNITEKPSVCPKCGSPHITFLGYGTQKAEEELKKLFPTARIKRLDSDSASGRAPMDDILERFRGREYDILLGTQMVAKGHDFPYVSLSAIISADMSLYVSDFRANERAYSLITQVMGRAGRADIPGRAVIQTYNPSHPVLRLAAEQDYDAFYEDEIAYRRSLAFPPFCDIISVMFVSDSESEVSKTASLFAARLRNLLKGEYADVHTYIFGPFEAPVFKVNEKYRMRVIVKCKYGSRVRELFSGLLLEFNGKDYKNINISADVNPTNI
jgi:primosomal protein N' (replication factor Y)